MAQDGTVNDAYTFVRTGFLLRSMLWTHQTECQYVIKNIVQAMEHLDKLSFTYPKSELQAVLDVLQNQQKQNGGSSSVGGHSDKLRVVADCIHDTIRGQAETRRLVLLQPAKVSAKLQELPNSRKINLRQTYLLDETVRCLETGTYRSAIVMGWNLVYDIIRQWFFDDAAKLALFNQELAKIQAKSQPKHTPIAQYEDFYERDAPGEKVVLELCRNANIISGNTYDDLRTYLRNRNQYAHAADVQPTSHQANAFLEHLLDILPKL